jgi:osmoprotectant transport system substrate-binding protein
VNLRRTLSIALAPLVVLAAACGDDDDTDTADVVSTAPEDTATEDTAAAPDTTGAAVTTAGSDTTSAPATSASGEGTTATSAAEGGTVPMGSGSITVGSADFPESQLLAQIYGQSLAAAGFDVSYQLGIGAREIYFDAVESGEVDLVPEYTNSLLSFVLRRDDPNATPDAANVDEQVAALGEALPEGLEVLTPSTAEDKDVIVCTAETAEEFSLTNLSDLAAVLDQITLGAPPEFEGRSPFGLAGFQQLLGAPPVGEFVPLDVGAVADALAGGQIDCGNLFSTMSVITTEGFVALEDDQTLVPNEAVLPLVRSDVVDEAFTAALDEANAALDTDALKALMVQVEAEALAPDVVAAEWLAGLD